MKYNFKKIEPKWQAKWEESKVFEAKDCLLYTSPSPRDRG